MEPRTDTSEIMIEVDAREVWSVLADEFIDIAAWAPDVISSGPNPATPEGINGSRYGGRIVEMQGLGTADVRLVAYDAQAQMLSYTLESEKLPAFVEKLQNTWTLSADGSERCSVHTQVEMTIADSFSNNEEAHKAADAMLATGAGASASLKTYIESDNYHARASHD